MTYVAGGETQTEWQAANPDTALIFFTVEVERAADGVKTVTGSQSGWQKLDATPDDERYWGRNTLVMVAPADWVCIDVDDPALACSNVDVDRLIGLSGGCHYVTSLDDAGAPKRHIWFRYPHGDTGPRYSNTGLKAKAGIDILTGESPRQVHVAGPGRSDPDSFTPGDLDDEVRGILDPVLARHRPQRGALPSGGTGGHGATTPGDVQWMLDRIDPTALDYDDWLKAGMGIHQWDPARMDLWDAWSRRDPDRYDRKVIDEKWGSFGGAGVTLGTLVHLAGGPPPPPSAEDGPQLQPRVAKTKQGSKPGGKLYALERPEEYAENDYWTWGGSFRRCMLHVGYHIRHNTRAEQIEYLPTGLKVGKMSPARIDRLARSKKPVKPMSAKWKPITEDVLTRLSEKISRYCRFASHEKQTVKGEEIAVTRWKPVNYGAGKDSYKGWRKVQLSAVSELRIDPFKHYLKNLPDWDGVGRIDTLLDTIYRVTDTPPEIAAAAAWATIGGAVQRTFRPGTEHHQNLILSGPGGIGKTKLWRYLMPDKRFYGESVSIADLSDPKLSIERVGNSVICEVAEVSAVSGKWDIERLKSVLSNPTMRARLAYAALTVDHECAHVFVATSNDDQPLPLDDALARRFLHVNVIGRMSEEHAEEGLFAPLEAWADENRDQVWAEAVHRLKQGESTFVPERLYKRDTLEQMHMDEDYELFLADLEGRTKATWTVAEMRADAYWERARDMNWNDVKFAKAAKRRGWTSARRKINGVRVNRWTPPTRPVTDDPPTAAHDGPF